MSGPVTTGLIPRLLLPGITELYGMKYKQLPSVHDKVYKKMKSERNYEEAVQMVGLGMAEIKGQGEAIAIDRFKQSYARRTQHDTWTKAVKITMEAFEDNLYQNQASFLSGELAKALFHAKESRSAALFNNATSTSAPYLGADGKAFLASDHPTGSGGTFSNIATSDISELALENAVINIYGYVGSDGLRMLARPKCLLIPRQSAFEAERILKSTLRSGTSDNDANALFQRKDIPQVLEWQFLTDSDSWFVLTDVDGLMYYERMAAKPHYHQDDATMDHLYSIFERYSFDYTDPRAVYGSMGA
jgi:hypothetical protein